MTSRILTTTPVYIASECPLLRLIKEQTDSQESSSHVRTHFMIIHYDYAYKTPAQTIHASRFFPWTPATRVIHTKQHIPYNTTQKLPKHSHHPIHPSILPVPSLPSRSQKEKQQNQLPERASKQVTHFQSPPPHHPQARYDSVRTRNSTTLFPPPSLQDSLSPQLRLQS
jgi:hypothetical protein